MKVLITGIAGKMGQLVAHSLLEQGHDVVGMDRRPWADAPKAIQIHEADIRKRDAEQVFRNFLPDTVIHMATVTQIKMRSAERSRINLLGTRAIFDHCQQYNVKQAIFVGRHTYYGAAPDSPLYHTEDEPPMGLEAFPELADLVAADLYAGSALWRMPELNTAVLRICYTLGPAHHGTLANYLQGPRVPTVLGFDPLFQFMHEHDAACAITLAMEKNLRGVFNVCGPKPMPLSTLIQHTNRTNVPIPERVFPYTMGKFGMPTLPKGATTHLKYPVVIDGSAFQKETQFQARQDPHETLHEFAQIHPAPTSP